MEDLWAWRIDDPDEFWRLDFTEDAYYANGEGSEFRYHTDSPSKYYVTPDSDLSMMQKFWVPASPSDKTAEQVERRIYLPADKINKMKSVGISTIRQLAEIDLYTLLKLRGFDYPQVNVFFSFV